MLLHVSGARALLSGATAGAVSTLLFTALHQLLISDIWASLVPMLVAGCICGICIAWSYSRVFRVPTPFGWIGYNLGFVALLLVLAAASLALFQPIATIPELLAANEPRRELIRRAMPLTVVFIVLSTGAIWSLWGRSLLDGVAILATCSTLIILLGLNVSVLGLVHLTSGAAYLVGQMFALIATLSLAYAGAFLIFERQRFQVVADAGETTPQRSPG